MILLITASERAHECATALQVATDQPTHCAKTLCEALDLLRCNEYVAVTVDQCLLDSEPEQSEFIIQHLGTAIPIHVNCALCGIDRIVGEVVAALHRREIEISKARRAAEEQLRSELREPLTAVLLNCDLLLDLLDLPPSIREKVSVMERMTREVCNRLEVKEESAIGA